MSSVERKNEQEIEKIFGRGGLIATYHEQYEYRPSQIEMAKAVWQAFEQERHLVVEAGTGTGKTLAYLIPAVAAAIAKNIRIVISTGTKNLQDQLMEKDIPFLQRILKRKFKVTYMKGRSNYVCLHRLKRAETQPFFENMEEVDYFQQIRKWAFNSETGDIAELTLPEKLPFWQRINARSEICLGQNCPNFDECFITKMRNQAEEAEIVIVNHHLFFADLSLRDNDYAKALPDYGAVIFDEAHLIEDIASEYFGHKVSNQQIEELIRDVELLTLDDTAENRKLKKLLLRILNLSADFWERLLMNASIEETRIPLTRELFFVTDRSADLTPVGEAYFLLDNDLARLETKLSDLELEETESLLRRLSLIRQNLALISKQEAKDMVYWIERSARTITLNAAPTDVSSILYERLFSRINTVILTSATLSSNGNFDFIKKRLGLSEHKVDFLIAPSSFNYEKQAIVYLPSGMPDPRSSLYFKRAAEEIVKLLNITNGRAFVLCTSNQSMNKLYELVRSQVIFPCFIQGSMMKTTLLEKFKNTPNAVLFATSSFWQGVDVRGEQLSCVIIDKLPFAVPTDPLVLARTNSIEKNGGNAFYEYSVPQAIIALKQGIGRLIRSKEDKGVIAILDSRLLTKPYGKEFLDSLPKMEITAKLKDVERFLRESDSGLCRDFTR
jgi:ATP-dependent DNA helicase DinG